jgi:DNA-directed RNA polymerase subunit M/transcription elongation factor TFIIS
LGARVYGRFLVVCFNSFNFIKKLRREKNKMTEIGLIPNDPPVLMECPRCKNRWIIDHNLTMTITKGFKKPKQSTGLECLKCGYMWEEK